MRKIIIEFYNGEYHFQFWSEGTLVSTFDSIVLDEEILNNFLREGIYAVIGE